MNDDSEDVGTLTLYHRTTRARAAEILRSGRMVSLENDGACYFSTHPDGHALGYGAAVVTVTVPAELAQLDDEFPDGERHYGVNYRDLRPEMFSDTSPETIANYLLQRYRAADNTGAKEEAALALVSHIEETGGLPFEWAHKPVSED